VASLHVSQFVFDTENDDGSYSDDYIEFEERKNGPGTVNLMFGVDAVQDRIADLGRSWMERLPVPRVNRRAGIEPGRRSIIGSRDSLQPLMTVDGETPTAKMGKRLWVHDV